MARKDCFKDLGVEKYIIVATLDSRTSDICRNLDGQIFNMSDYKEGITAPPFMLIVEVQLLHILQMNLNLGKEQLEIQTEKLIMYQVILHIMNGKVNI